MAKKPFVIDPHLTGITLAFSNPSTALIADTVMPRVPVDKEEFAYNSFPTEDAFTIPDTRVGRTSAVNQVEFSATRLTDQTEDYGLEDPIPNKDIENAQGTAYDPEGRAVEVLTDLIALDREVRTAAKVFNTASFSAGNKTTLVGVNQWSDATSKPIKAMEDAMDLLLVKPTDLVLGNAVWRVLSRHPEVLEAVFGSASTQGRIKPSDLASILGISRVQIGAAWVNTARKGQTASFARAWGKMAALLYINPNADTQRGLTFGVTAQFGTRVAGRIEDEDIGLAGGVRIRVGERVKEKVIAPTAGYLFDAAIA